MTNYIYDPDIDVGKKRPSKLLIGCGAGIVVTICVVFFIVVGGFAGFMALFGGEPKGLEVIVTTPTTQVSEGEDFEVSLELTNTGDQNITISEVQIPNDLLASALLTSVVPQGTLGMDYGDQTAIDLDLTIAPTGMEQVVLTFEALKAADIRGSVDVLVGSKTAVREVRLVISPAAVAVEPEETEEIIETEEIEETEEIILGEVIPYRSVVQIVALVEIDGELVEGWWGSGTVITEDGMILTNAHVVASDRYYDVVDLVVAITVAQDEPPVQKFYAEVLQLDANLDLAVIRVRSDLYGEAPNFESLGIEPVPLGNSNLLKLGDDLVIIGYPSIGGDTITLTRGEVSGFTAEEPYGNRAFIKTSASISGGNSGGLAANLQGEIVGVPTKLGSGDEEVDFVDCRRLADTNRDGVIDEYDNCVPTGGFINAIRPITLAEPMIVAAIAGDITIVEERGGEDIEEYDPGDNVILYDDFSDNRNEWGLLDYAEGEIEIVGGQLTIGVNVTEYYFWTVLPGTYDQKDLVTYTTVLNSAGDGDYGFVCGVVDGDNFTALEIAEDGYYSVWKLVGGEYVSLVEWSYSEMIASGTTFKLAVYCGPDRLALAANDVLIADTYDPEYTAGAVGLITGTYENPNLRVGFDEFYVLEPNR